MEAYTSNLGLLTDSLTHSLIYACTMLLCPIFPGYGLVLKLQMKLRLIYIYVYPRALSLFRIMPSNPFEAYPRVPGLLGYNQEIYVNVRKGSFLHLEEL